MFIRGLAQPFLVSSLAPQATFSSLCTLCRLVTCIKLFNRNMTNLSTLSSNNSPCWSLPKAPKNQTINELPTVVHTFPKFTMLKSIHLWFFCLRTTCTMIAWAKTNHLHLKNFQNKQYYLNSGDCDRNPIQTFPVQGHCHIPWQCHRSTNLGIKKKYSSSSWPS